MELSDRKTGRKGRDARKDGEIYGEKKVRHRGNRSHMTGLICDLSARGGGFKILSQDSRTIHYHCRGAAGHVGGCR